MRKKIRKEKGSGNQKEKKKGSKELEVIKENTEGKNERGMRKRKEV